MSLSHSFTFSELLFSNDLTFTPGLNISYGMIYNIIVNRKVVIKDNKPTIQLLFDKKVRDIAIFDYQLSLPFSYSAGDFTISVSYNIDFPQNALKKKSGKKFSAFSWDVSYTF